MTTEIEVPMHGCICGQCTIPVLVGPKVELVVARFATRISGVN